MGVYVFTVYFCIWACTLDWFRVTSVDGRFESKHLDKAFIWAYIQLSEVSPGFREGVRG